MGEAREPLAGTRPDGVGRCGVGIRRLPGSFYGEHAERRHGWHGNGRYRRSRPVPGLDGDDGSDDGARHATPDTPLPYHRPQPFEPSPGAGWRGDPAPGLYSGVGISRATSVRLQLVGRCCRVLGGAMVCLAAHHRRAYQLTPLKRICHAPCSSPLFFLMHNLRSEATGALRLGMLHGVDCLGCCAGLMVGLVALGMMNLAWMLTAALIIFAKKTLPNSHRIARPLGVVMVGSSLWRFRRLHARSTDACEVHGVWCIGIM